MSGARAIQLVEAGLWLRMSGDLEGARRLFEQALRLDPGCERAREMLGTKPEAAEALPEELQNVPSSATNLFAVPLPRLFPEPVVESPEAATDPFIPLSLVAPLAPYPDKVPAAPRPFPPMTAATPLQPPGGVALRSSGTSRPGTPPPSPPPQRPGTPLPAGPPQPPARGTPRPGPAPSAGRGTPLPGPPPPAVRGTPLPGLPPPPRRGTPLPAPSPPAPSAFAPRSGPPETVGSEGWWTDGVITVTPPQDAWEVGPSRPTTLPAAEAMEGDALHLVAALPASAGGTPLPTKMPSDPRYEAGVLLQRAGELQELDDHTGARELLLQAQALDPESPEVTRALAESEQTLQALYESKLGKLSVLPRVRLREDEVIWLNLDHRAGFILAQIDGSLTFEDLFSVSGMSRLDTARILVQLLEQRVIVR